VRDPARGPSGPTDPATTTTVAADVASLADRRAPARVGVRVNVLGARQGCRLPRAASAAMLDGRHDEPHDHDAAATSVRERAACLTT
jgi:hypothetical protein